MSQYPLAIYQLLMIGFFFLLVYLCGLMTYVAIKVWTQQEQEQEELWTDAIASHSTMQVPSVPHDPHRTRRIRAASTRPMRRPL